jgi:hypothetical protein
MHDRTKKSQLFHLPEASNLDVRAEAKHDPKTDFLRHNTAHYIHDLCAELTHLAEKQDLTTLVYLLSMAQKEAQTHLIIQPNRYLRSEIDKPDLDEA